MRAGRVVTLCTILWAARAGAQPSTVTPGDPAPGPPAAPTAALPPPPAPVSTLEPGVHDDANAGRVAIMPTALTPPAGTFAFEDWELFLLSVSYSPTDNLILTGTTMIPVTSAFYWGFASAKLKILQQGRLHLAVQGGIAGVLDSSAGSSSTSDSAVGFDLGAAATLCLDDACHSHLDGAVAAGFARQGNSSVPVGFMGGAVVRLSSHVRLLLEADTAHLFGNLSGQANGFLGWYGLRFTSRQIGVDLTLVKPVCSDCSSDVLPLGFPFVTFSYRALD